MDEINFTGLAPPSSDTGNGARADAVLDSCREILRPLVQLLLTEGVDYPRFAAFMKQQFVEEALVELQRNQRKITDSAVSVLSGVHRKDVRVFREDGLKQRAERTMTLASEIFTRWISDSEFRAADGTPLKLPRSGPTPSFDALARLVSKDVHPHSILNELTRLRIAEVSSDNDGEYVALCADAFIPKAGFNEMLHYFSGNLAAHLATSVANLRGTTPARLEQSVFADGLSDASIEILAVHARSLWADAFAGMVARATECDAHDQAFGHQRRMRFGVYFYADEPVLNATASHDSGEASFQPEQDSQPGQFGPVKNDGE